MDGRLLVDFSHGPIADSSALIERTGIPRKVLSRLFDSTRVGPGFRVLDVGCGQGELAAFLDSLGILCTGIDESPVNIVQAKRAAPGCDFTCGSISNPLSGPRGGFDLILVRDASQFHASLSTPAAISASLQLLSRVRPGGCLAFLARVESGSSLQPGHRLPCYAKHFGFLPGNADYHELPDGLIFGRTLRQRTSGQTGSGYFIALLQLPERPLSQEEWEQASEGAARVAAAPCCQWAARGSASVTFRSKAA
jgi:SAM-dependent methyltransferase